MKADKTLLRNAQRLRREMTREERHLWYDFLKTYPVQFKRQQIVGKYIADFYCFKAKLIVELDGSQHCEPEQMAYDRERTAYLEEKGFLVLRYSNLDVIRNFSGVCENIGRAVCDRLAT